MSQGRLCRGCGVLRTNEEFALKSRRTGKRHSRCKECCRRVSKDHYRLNHDAYIQRNRQNNPLHRKRNAAMVFEYLLVHPCVRCGESDPVVLEFNHMDPDFKTANISDLVRFGSSPKRLFSEIGLCEVMCANCHQYFTSVGRPRHYRRLGQSDLNIVTPAFRLAANARNHAVVLRFLANATCVDCGEHDSLVCSSITLKTS